MYRIPPKRQYISTKLQVVRFERFSQLTPITSLNTINWFVLVRKIQYVFCEVWAFDRPTS